MGTQHPSDQERRAIQARAKQGDESARDYLELLDTCIQILENSNGISLARGMLGEHNDVYGQAIDDALSELMPVIFRISAGGWDSLKYYVPADQQDQPTSSKPTGSYEADQQKARERMAVNQEYLRLAMLEAKDSTDPDAEARATLRYNQAMLHALMFLTRGTDCKCQPDIDALAKTARELDQKRRAYAASQASTGIEEVKAFIAECMTRLERAKNLCEVCQERQQFATLENFRALPSSQEPGA
jgi:hypothetical protein